MRRLIVNADDFGLTEGVNRGILQSHMSGIVTSATLMANGRTFDDAAQIRKVQSTGIRVSHVDTHKHTHLWPHVLEPVLRAAKSCGVKRIRNPFEPAPLRMIAQRPGLWKRYAQTRALSGLAYNFQKL